jgi:putative phage-type endonuclease
MKREQLSTDITRIQFDSMEEWLVNRKGIGGSDASAILGLNPYKTNQELWMEKKGQMSPVDISGKSYVKYGNDAEPLLRALFALDYPEYKVEYYDNNMIINKKYPWAHASLDGELMDPDGRRGILEIKTTNILQSMQWEKWDNRIPDNYYIQVLHYLLVTEYDFVVLKAQLKRVRDGEVRLTTKHYHIEREEVLSDIKMLKEEEEAFWHSSQSGQEPGLLLPEI